MKTVLFVDDEPQLLDGLKVALHGYRRTWRQRFALGGHQALEILANEPVDILVTDIRMPEMDGTQLLKEVQQRYPNIIRIVLSGYTDSKALMRTVSVSHQYLSKPVSSTQLAAAIERGCRVHLLMEDDGIRRLVGGLSNLPSVPQIYGQINALIASDKATPDKLAELLQQDMAMCVKILQVVNSSFFRLAREITSVKEAVVYLGIETISQLVLSSEVFGDGDRFPRIPGWDLQQVQKHSLMTASLASRLLTDSEEKSEAFMAGMLHDIGQLVLATRAPEDFSRALALSRERGVSMDQAEHDVFGVDHAAIGAYLLGIWGLPYSTVEAVARHHDYDRALAHGLDSGAAVLIAHELLRELDEADSTDVAPEGFARFIQVNRLTGQLEGWRELAQEMDQPDKVAA